MFDKAHELPNSNCTCQHVLFGTAREQVPLAELEGVQEHLASVGSNTLLVTSGQALMNSMLNGHEQPAVLSAVMKQQMTTRMRQNINDGMDVRESNNHEYFFFFVCLLKGRWNG